MYHTTGFNRWQILELCAALNSNQEFVYKGNGRPPALGIFNAVHLTLCYLRRNHVQQELAELFGISQASVSRIIARVTEALGEHLKPWVPTVDDLDSNTPLIVDGTLVPCWSWRDEPGLHSGKHHTTGMNLQVACTLSGHRVWVSDPVAGSAHDVRAIRESGILDHLDPESVMGDKGYIGLGMITPIRKPANRDLLDWEKEFNKDINQIRYVIERSIANLKTWRILHTDYRRPLKTFTTTISTVIALEFYKESFE